MIGKIRDGMRLVDGMVIALILAVMVVGSVATMTFAENNALPGANDKILRGEVVSIDNAQPLGVLTLRSSAIGIFPNDTINVFVTKDTKMETCKVTEPLKNAGVKPSAMVTYHELGGFAVADSVLEQC